jgi:site-specific DNA-methyltransferase (adenine-specific)/adenine-specific DNA-methyltransferase
MARLEEEGRIYYTKNGVARHKRYLDEMPGIPVSDLWIDIPRLNSQANEKLDYPTQKPEALVARIIRASSNPGDLIFDCFMGSGTTQAVAMKLGRRFIGADINLGAVQITTKRLLQVAQELAAAPPAQQQAMAFDAELDEEEAAPTPAEPTLFYTGFEVYNVNHYDIFRNPVEAKDLLLAALEVDRLPAGNLYDGLLDGRLVKVMPVNRIATRADLNELITGFDYRAFEKRRTDNPNQPVEKITLVCMGHEPDLAAQLKREVSPYLLDVQVVDILRDKQDLQFKRDAEARVAIVDGWLEVQAFYPMNLLQKLSLQKEHVEDWRELVESVLIDWNYDGAVLTPAVVDIPEKNELVAGRYTVPEDAGTVRVKITDLLSESWEGEVRHG